jgi:hypothetical protein
VLQALLDAGASPLLLDCGGNSPLDLAKLESGDGPLATKMVDKSALVMLLQEHTARYGFPLRGGGGIIWGGDIWATR